MSDIHVKNTTSIGEVFPILDFDPMSLFEGLADLLAALFERIFGKSHEEPNSLEGRVSVSNTNRMHRLTQEIEKLLVKLSKDPDKLERENIFWTLGMALLHK